MITWKVEEKTNSEIQGKRIEFCKDGSLFATYRYEIEPIENNHHFIEFFKTSYYFNELNYITEKNGIDHFNNFKNVDENVKINALLTLEKICELLNIGVEELEKKTEFKFSLNIH
jgi:hypothetical protein